MTLLAGARKWAASGARDVGGGFGAAACVCFARQKRGEGDAAETGAGARQKVTPRKGKLAMRGDDRFVRGSGHG